MSGYQINGISGIGLASAVFAINTNIINTGWLTYTLADPAAFSYNGINLPTKSIIALPNNTSVYKINVLLNQNAPTTGINFITLVLNYSSSNNPYSFTSGLSYQEYINNSNQQTYSASFLHNSALGQYIAIYLNVDTPNSTWSWSPYGIWSRIHIQEIP